MGQCQLCRCCQLPVLATFSQSTQGHGPKSTFSILLRWGQPKSDRSRRGQLDPHKEGESRNQASVGWMRIAHGRDYPLAWEILSDKGPSPNRPTLYIRFVGMPLHRRVSPTRVGRAGHTTPPIELTLSENRLEGDCEPPSPIARHHHFNPVTGTPESGSCRSFVHLHSLTALLLHRSQSTPGPDFLCSDHPGPGQTMPPKTPLDTSPLGALVRHGSPPIFCVWPARYAAR
jgi:hypothetical protein